MPRHNRQKKDQRPKDGKLAAKRLRRERRKTEIFIKSCKRKGTWDLG